MAEKRNSIIEATIELFSDRHYDGMTIPMIAKKANIAVGTMYNYFENKESLINEIYRQIFEKLNQYLIENSVETEDYKEEFKLCYKNFYEFSIANSKIILFLKYNSNAYYISDKSKESKQKMVLFLNNFIQKGIRLNKVKNISKELFLPLIYAPIEMIVTNYVKKEIDDPNKYFEEMFEIVWNSIKK